MPFNQYGGPTVGNAGLDSPQYTTGWNTETSTGDEEGATVSGNPSGAALLGEPSALSGFMARSLDPDVMSAGKQGTQATYTFVTGTAILIALQVLEGGTTSKLVVDGNTAGPPTHAFAGLYDARTGVQQAAIADQGATGFGTTGAAVTWATASSIPAGFYWAVLLEVGGTMGKLNVVTLSPEAQVLLTSTAALPFTFGSTLRFAVGGTGLTGLSALPTALTTSMVVSASATGAFVGIA